MAKNKTGSLDTNILLRLIVGDVPAQTKLVEKLIVEATKLDVADIVIFELVFVLEKLYFFSRSDVASSVSAIIRNKKINSNRKLFEPMLSMYLENPKLSFVDCTLPQYARLNKAEPLFTFDQKLAKTYDAVMLLTE
jgi:predicted nucleic-acid-binding protein